MLRQLKQRGFVLVIVIVIGAAAALIAAALLASSQAARVGTANQLEGDVTDALARSGVERASAYLTAMAKAGGDLDLALDPNLAANCGSSPPTCTDPLCNVPNFTDGTQVTYNGKRYTMVPVTGVGSAAAGAVGGAYLVRFDDDSDDEANLAPNPWAENENNHKGPSNNCLEGPAFGQDNPFRDRNRSIFITSIGVAPGVDPATATHRTVVRKIFEHITPPTVHALTSGNNTTVGGAPTKLALCSPVGDDQIGNDFQGSSASRSCTCGDSVAGNNFSAASHCDTGGPGLCSPGTCASGSNIAHGSPASSGAPPLPWGQCNFYVGVVPGLAVSLWYWDAGAAARDGGANCPATPSTNPPAAPLTAGEGGCWTPILVGIPPLVCIDPFGSGEVNTATCDWKPGPTPFSLPGATLTTNLTAAALTFTGTTYNKPNWQTQCGLAPAYPLQAGRTACTTCTGGNVAMKQYAGGPYFFSGTSAAEITAVPTGVYFFPGNLTLPASVSFAGTVPPQAPGALVLDDFPLATVVVQGNFDGNSAAQYWLGTGTSKADYASLMVGGDISDIGNAVRVAGTIWGGNNITWNSPNPHTFDGEIHAANDLTFSGGGTFVQQYLNALQQIDLTTLTTSPLTYVSNE